MNIKKQHPIFTKSLVGVITIIVLGSVILIRGTKGKTEFQTITGRITYLEKTYQELPNRHHGKFRYLAIENYPRTFELFVGKDFGDFKPQFERIDDLRAGDNIVVYFEENSNETDARLNRLIQFIDKDGQPYFVRGSKDKTGGYSIIVIGILLGGLIFYLKKTGRII